MSDKHEKISVSDSSYTLELKDSLVSNISFKQNGNKVTLSGTTAGYKKVGNAYEWQAKTGGETLTISDGIIDTSALATTAAEPAKWNGNTYVFSKTASSWTTGKSTVKYTATTGGNKLFTLSGTKTITGITVDTAKKISPSG